MSNKFKNGEHFIMAVTDAIKKDSAPRELYRAIYGTEPDRIDLQKFTNRLNPARSNPGTDLLGACVEHSKNLSEMTLAEFFGLDKLNKK